MKLLAALALTVISAAAFAASPEAYDKKVRQDPFYDGIVATAKRLSGRKMVEYLNTQMAQDATRVPVVSLWLRENSVDEDDARRLQSLYFLSYSDTLQAMAEGARDAGDPGGYRDLVQTAMLNLYLFEITAGVDAARCQDKTAREAVGRMVDSRFEQIRTAYRAFPRSVFDEMEKTALRHEDKFLARSPNADICTYGKAYVIDLAKTPGVERKSVPDPLAEGGKRLTLIAPAGYNYVPGFVSDAQWLEARKAAIAEISKRWAQRYAAAIR
ncbi:MAG TPA: hypothetical protein VEF76_13705 [Patescibacteria group bacterium]|nr:hypothetical protein [Patescibacteria group bacterium]